MDKLNCGYIYRFIGADNRMIDEKNEIEERQMMKTTMKEY